MKNLPTIFHSGCTDLHSHQWYAEVSFFHHPHQHLSLYVLIIAILTVVRWYLTVILVCIFLMISDVEHLSCTCWPFVCLWENVYSSPLPVLKSDCLYFCYWVAWVLCIFWILTPYQLYGLQIRLPSHFVDCYAEAFSFNVVTLVDFCFCCLCL